MGVLNRPHKWSAEDLERSRKLYQGVLGTADVDWDAVLLLWPKRTDPLHAHVAALRICLVRVWNETIHFGCHTPDLATFCLTMGITLVMRDVDGRIRQHWMDTDARDYAQDGVLGMFRDLADHTRNPCAMDFLHRACNALQALMDAGLSYQGFLFDATRVLRVCTRSRNALHEKDLEEVDFMQEDCITL